MTRSIVFLTMLIVFMAPSAYGQIYKWVDEKGKVHYSDIPVSSPKLESKNINPEQNNMGGCDSNCMAKIDDPDCKFTYYTRDGDYGKKLASDAKEECLINKRNKYQSGFAPKSDARERHFQYYSKARKETMEHLSRAREQGERDMERIQKRSEERARQEKLDNITKKQDAILDQQEQLRQRQEKQQYRSYNCQRDGLGGLDCRPR
ncbi:MAG TPA: DUF4124 domain-containing protein [Bellilinea sp.]|nr:DUF4124 domain-containing protein [Bellilinea sp.]